MIWENLIHNASVLLGTSEAIAGSLLALLFTCSVLIAIYILARSENIVHHTNTWMGVSFVICLIIFTYPIQWIPLWYGLLTVLALSIIMGYGLSKTARGGEG